LHLGFSAVHLLLGDRLSSTACSRLLCPRWPGSSQLLQTSPSRSPAAVPLFQGAESEMSTSGWTSGSCPRRPCPGLLTATMTAMSLIVHALLHPAGLAGGRYRGLWSPVSSPSFMSFFALILCMWSICE